MQQEDLSVILQQQISIDFIMLLLESKDLTNNMIKYDVILVIMDRFTKFVILIPIRNDISTENIAYLLIQQLLTISAFPKQFIIDRDKIFIAKIQQELIRIYNIKHNITTANHQ